ncbi:Hypothetical predicted protein [Olea europaea subsp. europaea]|uniref:DUF3741 domain-containing protein n=1 Tax=Olea europaea subsp. europaea TaxID=158383 RepID=A0A8S0TSM2_OLEEU|nr:Hypothetical predicted protein [Olea europaea subsp. europaea]
MESLLHFLDANEDRMARKVVMHKRLDGGLEAPRNSLEIPLETSYSLCAARESIPYAYHKKKEFEKNCYSNEAPMKKLISEEISKRPNTRQNAPSIVARLMGVDMLPFDSKPASKASEMKNETPESNFLKKQWSGTNSGLNPENILKRRNYRSSRKNLKHGKLHGLRNVQRLRNLAVLQAS